jgi:hypothetical protein
MDGERIAAVVVPLPNAPVGAVKDVLGAVRPRQPKPNLDGFPAVWITVGSGLAVDLNHPPATAGNYVDALVHRSLSTRSVSQHEQTPRRQEKVGLRERAVVLGALLVLG